MNMVDSMKELANYIEEGEKKYIKGENNAAYEIFLKCEELALKTNEQKLIAECTKNVGRILHRMGNYKEAKEKYLKALEILNENDFKSELPRFLNHLANVYQFTNEFDKQWESLTKALKISKELGDLYLLAKISNSIGVYYEVFGKYKKALYYMEEALKYFETKGGKYALAKTLNLLSSVKTKMKHYSSALIDANKAYEISKNNDDVYNVAYSLRNIIRIFYNQKEYEKCLYYFDELLDIKDKLENKKMNCDILRVIGLVYQEFNEKTNAYNAIRDSLYIAKQINYYHGIAKSNEILGDILLANEEHLEAYRYYSNSLKTFHLILNSIKDQSLRESYKSLFNRLPQIIRKVDSILENRSYELPSKELKEFSEEAIKICLQVQKEDLDKNVSKKCSNNVKKLNANKNQDFKIREKIQEQFINILTKSCFMKLDKETQDYLVRYKLNVIKIPDDYKSFIRKISNAIECEIRLKIFESFYYHWNNHIKIKLKNINGTNVPKNFMRTYNELRAYLEENKFLELGSLYFILSTLIKSDSLKKIHREFMKPFDEFIEYLGTKNMEFIKQIVKFFDRKYKCGNEYHYFINIRNKCSHGGGRIQEKRRHIEIKIEEDTFREIENNLLNEDIRLLENICSLEI